MEGVVVALWIIRLAFLAVLYAFLFLVARVLMRDLRSATRSSDVELGRLVVTVSPGGDPPEGAVFVLDAISTIGRDVNNTVVIDDSFVSAEHAALAFRGRGWSVEDLESTNGTYVNGHLIDGTAMLGFGDELQVGRVRLRLERPRR